MPPVYERPLGLRCDLLWIRIREFPPGFYIVSDLVDYWRRIVFLLLVGQIQGAVEEHLQLILRLSSPPLLELGERE
jgi:hypothetical protein